MVTGPVREVEMADANVESLKDKSKEETKGEDVDLLTLEDIKDHMKQIEKSVVAKEPRYLLRVLRQLRSIRPKLNFVIFKKLIQSFVIHDKRESLHSYITISGKESDAIANWRPKTSREKIANFGEMEFYIELLLTVHLIDQHKLPEAISCAEFAIQRSIECGQKRSAEPIVAKVYFYFARAHELSGSLASIRSQLHSRLRTTTLRKDHEGAAVLINLLLRSYLEQSLYEQAHRLVSKCSFPDQASNGQWARYLYYLGRIQATQLEYTEAQTHLVQALRKAPQHGAVGFKQTVNKFLVVVELLLGDIPDRALFRQPQLRGALLPYFQLTQAVKTGNLARFGEVVENFQGKFQAENTWSLIIRLRHNVIKTGIRMINLSYSRISLVDVAQKLQLDSAEEAEYIVAKAIRDGVIEAVIDHERGFVKSREIADLYGTLEPMRQFHQRIKFCLDIYNQSVKAMRFPPKSYNKDLETAEERREREQQDLEYAKELAEDDDDDFP